MLLQYINTNRKILFITQVFLIILFLFTDTYAVVQAGSSIKFSPLIVQKNGIDIPSPQFNKNKSSIQSKAIQNIQAAAGNTMQSSLNHLPLLANGEVALPSNANHFNGQWNAGVDARTGRPTFSIALGSILFHHGRNRRDIKISYQGDIKTSHANTFDMGSEWIWNIGSETLSTTEISGHRTTDIHLSDGHGFTMKSIISSKGRARWSLVRHKLKDVLIKGRPNDWTVSTATGIREHIVNGYEDWEESSSGKKVWIYYDSNNLHASKRRLIYICAHPLTSLQLKKTDNACKKDGIWITYHTNEITIHAQQNIVLTKKMIAGHWQITSISMPSLSSEDSERHLKKRSKIFLDYDERGDLPWLLRSVTYPSGITNTFYYNTEADHRQFKALGLPVSFHNALLPVVTEMKIHDRYSPNMHDTHIWYRYSHRNDQHNYTGYQHDVKMLPGKDNLMDCADDYAYSVTKDNGVVSKTTTYNKYHLPIQETEMLDSTHKIIGISNYEYPAWKKRTFSQLKPTYSLPIRITKTFFNKDSDGVRHSKCVTQERQYNNYGQLIWERKPTGEQIFRQYCSNSENKHCQPNSKDWPKMPYLEKILYVPAATSGNLMMHQPDAIETAFDYMQLKRNSNKQVSEFQHHMMLVSQKTIGVIPYKKAKFLKPGSEIPDIPKKGISTQTFYHYDNKTNSYSYGEIVSLSVLKINNKISSIHQRLFNLSALHKQRQNELLTLKVIRTINPSTNAYSIKYKIDPLHSSPNNLHASLLASNFNNINFGKEVYSMQTGNKLQEYDALETMRTEWVYDNWNRPIKVITIPKNFGKPKIQTWRYINDGRENSVIIYDPSGVQRKIVFNGYMQIKSEWFRYKKQNINGLKQFSDWILKSKVKYDEATGKKSSTTQYIAKNNGKMIALTTRYGYDTELRNIWTQTPDGHVDMTVYDDSYMRVYKYRINKDPNDDHKTLGCQLKVVDANVRGQPVAVYMFPLYVNIKKGNQFLYSQPIKSKLSILKQKLVSVYFLKTLNSSGLSILPSLRNFVRSAIDHQTWYFRVHFIYDGFGHIIQQVSSNGAIKKWIWDQGNRIAEITPDHRMIHDEFNLQGKKIARCVQFLKNDAKLNYLDGICHPLGYKVFDQAGRMTQEIDETGTAISYQYDGDGRLIKKIIPSSDKEIKHILTFRYNSISVVEKDLDGKPIALYDYDPNSWQIKDAEDHVSHEHYEYEPNRNLLTKVIQSAPKFLSSYSGINYPGGTIKFSWNDFGDCISLIDEEKNQYIDIKDNVGRFVEKRVYIHGSKTFTSLIKNHYDSNGYLSSVTTGAGITKTFNYNHIGQIQSVIEAKRNGDFIQKMNYLYDWVTGYIVSMKRTERDPDLSHHTIFSIEKFRYDRVGNLTYMHCYSPFTPNKNLCPRDMDVSGSGLTERPIILSQQYRFDHWNNISNVQEILTTSNGSTVNKTVHYEYADSNKNMQTELYNPHQLIGYGQIWGTDNSHAQHYAIVYDRLGRVIKDASGNQLHYNEFGQQDQFFNIHTHETTHYTYNSKGLQIAEQTFDAKHHSMQKPLYIFYSGNHITKQVQMDSKGQKHVSEELCGVAHVEDGSITRWYLSSYKGDVLSTVDSNGNLTEDHVYSPYGMDYDLLNKGNLINKTWLQTHKPGFNGVMTDFATQYQFLGGGYRAYNPIYRRFMTKDSLSPFLQIDGYGYGSNNPIMNSDPSGHSPEPWLALNVASVLLSSLVLAAILPISAFLTAYAMTPTVTMTENFFAAGLVSGAYSLTTLGSGVISGSLQIGSIEHPNNSALLKASHYIGLASNLLFLGMSTASMLSTGMTIIDGAKRTLNFLTLGSALSSGATVGLGSIVSTLQVANDFKASLASRTGYRDAMKDLSYISQLLTGVSLLAVFGSICVVNTNFYELNTARKIAKNQYNLEKIVIQRTEPGIKTFEDDLNIEDFTPISIQHFFSEEPNSTAFTQNHILVTDTQPNNHILKSSFILYSMLSDTAYIVNRRFMSSRTMFPPTDESWQYLSLLKKPIAQILRSHGYRSHRLKPLFIKIVGPKSISNIAEFVKFRGIVLTPFEIGN